nr:hypothetical protein CFP56_77746 [Quercus suber]
MAEEHSKSKENVLNSAGDNPHVEVEGSDRDEAVELVETLERMQKEQLASYVDIYGGDAPNIHDYGTKPDKIMDEESVDSQSISSESNHSEKDNNPESNSSEKGSEKGSLVDDFADVSTEPVDYMGGDD